MSTRDEMAAVIVEAYGENPGNCPCEQDLDVADALLAAGYRKPRIITTAEELDALTGSSIIRDSQGFGWQKYNRPISDKPAWFSATRNDGFYFSSNFADDNRLPATVLHEPEATS